MIDPDGIQILEANKSNSFIIKEVPDFDMSPWILEDPSDYKKYITTVERVVRKSYEYREFIKYLRENMSMNKCLYLNDISNKDTYNIKIEIHHYPFTLRDICDIVYRKREYYNENLSVEMVAKEVMELHYKLAIGLVPLSETVHELAHSGKIFIPVDKVLGRYKLFVMYYEPFIDKDQLEVLDRIEKYTEEGNSRLMNTTILNQNNITYDIQDNNYKLPDFSVVNDTMVQQIKMIKENNYLLPTKKELDERVVKEAVSFDNSLRNYNKYPDES